VDARADAPEHFRDRRSAKFCNRIHGRFVMAIYQTGAYRVKPESVAKVKAAIEAFVAYLQANEPGTQMYLVWQEKDDPTRFVHLFIFADAAAHERHGQSEAVKRFESVYSPELVGGNVIFTGYEMIAGKR
jgi:quinol monooxygenase YgiN